MPILYEYAIKAVLVLALAAAAWWAYHSFISKHEKIGYEKGVAEYTVKINKINADRENAQRDFEASFFKEQEVQIAALEAKRQEILDREIALQRLLRSVKPIDVTTIAKETTCSVAPIVNGVWNVRATMSGNIERAVKEK